MTAGVYHYKSIGPLAKAALYTSFETGQTVRLALASDPACVLVEMDIPEPSPADGTYRCEIRVLPGAHALRIAGIIWGERRRGAYPDGTPLTGDDPASTRVTEEGWKCTQHMYSARDL
jgi:hypothetical protein